MRIACVHIPQFALQCVTRVDPSLRGAAVAVVGAGVDPVAGTVSRVALHSPVVQACSRAAWALGVRIGMTATAARSVSPELSVVTADATLERDTVRAMADVLLGAGAAAANPVVVDLGGRVGPAGAHFAMYCEVPSKTRGTTFGDRLVERLTALGLTARIGIADDRFTAWVAASSGVAALAPASATDKSAGKSRMTDVVTSEDNAVISVPRGGSAAFLAPRPLSLLSIPSEVQHMLESLGVSTLGEFAALPPPSVHLSGPIGMRSRPVEADFQALARGDSGTSLRAYAPDSPIAEQAIISESTSMPAAVALLAERIAMRLAGRSRGATRLELHVTTAAAVSATAAVVAAASVGSITKAIASATSPRVNVIATSAIRDGKVVESGEDLADAIGRALAPTASAAGVITKLRVVVTGEAIAGDALAAELADTAAVADSRDNRARTLSLADALSTAASTVAAAGARVARTAKQATLRIVPDELAEIEDAVHETASSVAAVIDPLEVVLSNTGNGAWQLTTPSLRDERRDAHRRTQRGKERRHRARAQQALVQPRLFKTV